MTTWRQRGSIWQLLPPRPQALVEFIGGSYLAATPQVSYRRLLENLAARDLAVHAWSYVPGFDHQAQARQAWSEFRSARTALADRLGLTPVALRVGHSLGCKLHLLAPDGGRRSNGLIALSFNNFNAERSIPFLGDLAPRLGVVTEFSPSPAETLRLVQAHYLQQRNLVVRFGNDELDQSSDLIATLNARDGDQSEILQCRGDHLTPASIGLRRSLVGDWADDHQKQATSRKLAELIRDWAVAS